ncbi:MAG TPA: two-component regulator propeller domain-containing protein, partial [Chitinophagaceae bacterium]
MPLLLLTIVAIILSALQVSAQVIDEERFIRYTASNGLSDNYIREITQDSTGYIWIATNRGLNRFDGHQFKPFYKNSGYNPIPDNNIYSMGLLGSEIFLATSDGAQVLSTRSLEQTNLDVPTSDQLRYWSNACLYIRPDLYGNICLSTKTGMYVFTKNGKLKNRFDYYTEKDIGHTWMLFGNRLYTLPNGNILQLNSTGLLIYDAVRNEFIRDSMRFSPGLKKILSIWNEQKTILFTVSHKDVLVLNFKNNSFDLVNVETGSARSFKSCFNFNEEMGWQTKLHHLYQGQWAINSRNKGFFILQIDTLNRSVQCSPNKYFGSHTCNSIFADKQKRLWVGTTKGLYMEKKRTENIKTFAVRLESGNHFITSVFATKDKLFAGTSNRKIIVFNKHTKEITREIALPDPQMQNNIINQIVPMNGDTVWLTVNREIWWLNTRDLQYRKIPFHQIDDSTNFIGFLYRDRSGNVWINSNRINTIYKYNPTTGFFKVISEKQFPKLKLNAINAVAEDNEGKLWMSGDALVKWDINKNQVDTLIQYLPTQRTRKKGFIVMADDRGDVWTMVNDDGYARLTGKLIHNRPPNLSFYSTGNLLPTILKNKVFIPANEGVGYYDIQHSRGVLFTINDGLPDELVTTYRFVTDPSDNSTWFACKNFICNLSFSPETYSITAPLLTISELSINNGKVINYPGEIIHLRHNQNDLRLLFSGINFTDAENMRYAYRFSEGADSSWTEAGNQPQINLSNIGPGTYKLEVKVYAYDNKWAEQTREMIIRIKAPFWKTTWFFLSAIILVAGSVFWLYRYRVRQIRQKANLDKLLAQTEMKALHAQMNPHFIFNCL